MNCEKCGNILPYDSLFCNNCGAKVENDMPIEENTVEESMPNDTAPKTKKMKCKSKIILAAVLLVIVGLSIVIWQANLYDRVSSLYSAKKYRDAYELSGGLFSFWESAELKNKINSLQWTDWNLRRAKKYKDYSNSLFLSDESSYKSGLVETIGASIGYHDEAENNNVLAELQAMRDEAVRLLVQAGYSGADIKKSLETLHSSDFHPLCFTNKEKVDILIEKVVKSVSGRDVERVRNDKDPLRLENLALSTRGDYTYYSGSVKNYGSKTFTFVKVRAVYMDANKDVLTTDWTYAVGSEGIKSGESVQFEMMTKVRGTVKHGNMEIIEYK